MTGVRFITSETACWLPGWLWFAAASIYAQWMALFCAAGLCLISGWTGRFSSDGAWVFSWLMVLFLSMVFSFAAWLGAGGAEAIEWDKRDEIRDSGRALLLGPCGAGRGEAEDDRQGDVGEGGGGEALGEQERHTTDHAQRGERDDEGRDALVGDEVAVADADDGTEQSEGQASGIHGSPP